jgi:uncharacterized protein (DUF58 family)
MPDKIPPDLFRDIRRLQIVATRKVDSLFAGAYRSTFKGRGIEFEGVREYQPGDEIHHINWFLTAHTQRPFVKTFKEERELTVMLLVDVSASARFGSSKQFKNRLIAEIGAILAFSAIKNHDKVGLLLFSNEMELYLKPKKEIRHVLRVIRELLFFKPRHSGTDLKKALVFLGQVQRKKTVCFVISDCLAPPFERELKIAAKRHELIFLEVYDPHEESFPNLGLLRLMDLESGEMGWVDTADPEVRRQFHELSKERRLKLKKTVERIGATHIGVRSDESPTDALRNFFRMRRARR